MTALYIIGGIALLIALILLLPITAQIKFKDDLSLKIKFLGITVYKLKEEEKEKSQKTEKASGDTKPPQKEQGIFAKLKAKYGFKGAIKELFDFAGKVINKIKPQLLKIKFRKFKLDLIIVGEDAAMTAIEYGAVCGVVYPVLSFIDQNLNIKLKQINVQAGFKHTESEFSTSFDVKANALLLSIIAFKALKEYKNFSVRNEL